MRKILILGLALFCCLNLCGQEQEKYEKEYRIGQDQVPQSALDYITKFNFNKKIKWYREESLIGASVEAKTKYQKQRYSIEFDTLGGLQDVEIKINFEDLNEAVQRSICDILSQEFDRYKLQKIQQQFSGSAKNILSYLKLQTNERLPNIKIQFEIVLAGKRASKVELYEYTFSEQGGLVSKSHIVLRNTDILEY